MSAAAIDPLLAFLDVRQEVESTSDEDLVRAVEAASLPSTVINRLSKGVLEAIPALNRGLTLAPSDLLGELAIASCPPRVLGGMRDLTLRWSWLRYCWAFEKQSPQMPMRPSEAVLSLVHHHRTLASEQLGIGMALVAARHYLQGLHAARDVMFFDADFALAGWGSSMLGVSQVLKSSMRPDYFALVDGLTSIGPKQPGLFLYTVECKGSYYPIYASQLKKAACQVEAVRNGLGSSPPSLLFATLISRREFHVRALDPASEGWWATPEQVAEASSSLDQVAGPDSEGMWHISDVAGFLRGLQELGEAALLSFAGQYRSAQERAPRLRAERALSGTDDATIPDPGRYEDPLRREELKPDVVDVTPASSSSGEELGTRLTMPLQNGQSLDVFTGVQRDRLQAARSGDLQRARKLRSSSPPTDQEPDETQLARTEGLLRKPLHDGRVLELRIG